MKRKIPPEVRYFFVKLPLTTLHLVKAGTGKPLIMVPATISNLENWISLVQFMAQKYTVYFFELPGHGQSTPFTKPFTPAQVTRTIEDLADKLRLQKFSLLGFSFGGILALSTLAKLKKRISKVILIAPCVSSKAIKYSQYRMALVRNIHKLFKKTFFERGLLNLMHNPKTVNLVVKLLTTIGRVEKNMKLKDRLLSLPKSTLDILIGQTESILTADFSEIGKFRQPTFFAMSVNDPLLDFNLTLNFMTEHFENLKVIKSHVHYHQPRKSFSFKQLNRKHLKLLNNL